MISISKSRDQQDRIIQRRILIVAVVVLLLMLILIVRLAYLQISQYQRFSTSAQDNRIALVPLPPVRGLMRDRNGIILAENFHAYTLQILPERIEDMDAVLNELGKLVELGAENLRRFQELLTRRPPFEWQILRANLNEEEAARVALDQHRYPGVELRANLQRSYPLGELTAHTIGYVGRISVEDLESINQDAYRGLEYIGRSGLEAHYESKIRGTPGVEHVETDAHGRVVRSLKQTTPQAGQNIHLSLDIELQRKSIQALQGYEGAIVALEPHSGEVLAFASAPGFDPNPFVNGISEQNYAQLRDAPEQPLLNRALSGRYAPGSTIKGFLLLAGLENELNRDEQIFCSGWYRLPHLKHLYRDWKREGHGYVDAHDSLVQSCDIFFYKLADELGIDNIYEHMSQFGFGRKTGVDLPSEPSGLLPSPKWKRQARGQPWYPGETLITGIGQGYMLVTPLQLATATAMLANRGRRVLPRFITAVENPQTGVRKLLPPPQINTEEPPISDDSYQYIIDGMRDVVHGYKGTAQGIKYGIRYKMAGKTGTAQVKSIAQDEEYDDTDIEKKFKDHSLFIAFAPLEDPKIAIAVIVEHAGSGSRVAAPIARKLLDYYLIDRLGLFADTATGKKVVTAKKAE